MVRTRIPLLLSLALLIPVSARAVGVPELPGNSFTVSGVYSLSFNVSLASRLPAGTTITCRVRIAPNQGGFNPGNQQLAPIPVRTVAGPGEMTGSTATCAAEIPFSWTVLSVRDGAVLSYEVDAVSNSGSIPLVIRSSGQQNLGVAFPASGGSARLSFNLTF